MPNTKNRKKTRNKTLGSMMKQHPGKRVTYCVISRKHTSQRIRKIKDFEKRMLHSPEIYAE